MNNWSKDWDKGEKSGSRPIHRKAGLYLFAAFIAMAVYLIGGIVLEEIEKINCPGLIGC